MGVRGLTTFFNQNPDFFKPYKLHDSFVIVDGDNLIHALYFNNKINVLYGGDYKKYAYFVRRYLLAYLECNISPIIVFDGGYDKSGRKLKTISDRAKQRLEQVKSIARNGSYHERVLPILARTVFISVLVELNVVFAVCDYEADDQITALANYYKCPVISADSDFYIYDLHKGFIRLDTIDTTDILLDVDSDGKKYSYLSCSIYHVDEFIAYFPGIRKDVLPLFGALMGNDYVEAKEFDNFFSNIQLPKYQGRKLILNTKQKKMIGLLCWLKNYTLSAAIDQVAQYLKKDKRNYIKSVIENAISGYELHSSKLSQVIDAKLYDVSREICLTSQLTFPCGKPLPSDFVLKFHSGFYSSFFINVIVSRKVFLNAQIEDIASVSSYACSRYIRKIIYGILIRHDACQNEKCLTFIEENDRQGSKFKKELVEPIFSLEDIGSLPKVDELNEIKKEKYLTILTKILGVNPDYFSHLPEDWRLLIGCLNYCLRNYNPHFTESFLYALILNLIYFGVIDQSVANQNKYKCPNRNPSGSNCACSAIDCILSKISKSESESVKLKLKKHGEKPRVNCGNPLLIRIVHSFSQLQSCVVYVIFLNKLLGNHFRNTVPQTCFSGVMLYNLAKDISTRLDARLFVSEILGRGTNLDALFTSLVSKVCEDVSSTCILKDERGLLKVKKRKKKTVENVDAGGKSDVPVIKTFDVLNRKEML